MTETEKKLYSWVKTIYEKSGSSFGSTTFAGVYIENMTQKELALLCNILANELYSGTPRIKISIELETE